MTARRRYLTEYDREQHADRHHMTEEERRYWTSPPERDNDWQRGQDAYEASIGWGPNDV